MTGSPVIDDKDVFIGNSDGRMFCLDLESGAEKWSFECEGPVYATAAVSDNRLVFTSADSCIYVLDRDKGEKLWSYKTRGPVIAVPVIHDGRVFAGASDSSFRAFDLETGELLWEYNGVEGYVETKPLVHHGKVIFGAWDGKVYALNTEDGSPEWIWQDGRPGKLYSPAACWPVASGDNVYIVAPDRFMTAIDAQSGKTVWRTNRHKVRETIGISEDAKTVYARCMRDTVFAIAASRERFSKKWTSDFGYGYDIAPSMPMEKEGTLYFGTKNGLIVAADAKTGRLKWKHKLGNALINTVAPVDEQRVVVSNIDGIVAMLGN